MHDPNTVAFTIPWRYRWSTLGKKRWRYWVPLITIWHVDPEKGGSDDSCGWFRPPLTEVELEIIKTLAGDEAYEPWFTAKEAKRNIDAQDCETLLRGAFLYLSRCLVNRNQLRKPVTLDEATEWAIWMTHNHVDNFRSSLCFLSGYHSNWINGALPNTEEQDKYFRERQARDFFRAIVGYIQRQRRPWYRHPRWHIWHWHLQIHPLENFKRWAFSRCCRCGKRFAWGTSVCTGSWQSDGPRWFRSEPDVYHADCDSPRLDPYAQGKRNPK